MLQWFYFTWLLATLGEDISDTDRTDTVTVTLEKKNLKQE